MVDFDWIPGVGVYLQHNGKALLDKPIASERAYKVVLKAFIGEAVTPEFRRALLGEGASATP